MIDFRRLEVLRAVHRHGTVTAAAAALHLTPSAVSHQLRELARELKVQLVEPQGRRIRLTGAAHLVMRHGDALLARWEEAESALAAFRAGEAGLLRVCGFPSAVTGLIAPATALLRKRHPGLTVEVTECEAPAGFDLLMSTDADIAVLAPPDSFPPPGDSRFDQRPLLEEPFDLLLPTGHPLAGRASVHLAETATEDWVLPLPDSCDHNRRVMVFCAMAGFTPRIAHHVQEWSAIAAMVCHGLGVSLYPRLSQIPAGLPVTRVPVTGEGPMFRRILTCVRGGSADHPMIRHGLEALTEVVASNPTLTPNRPAGALS
ncbi:LysR family transcriptional regulator [Streptomyces litchfieldiae]|uniref:LysR family transcriptional regulator n=1 Tax=Streptomyces litchfieldiae TaxID=3075543 RepID=A0ABU2MXK8_9ACTN|nr:LysR family transcriptional regulator [Streptomyces sp. DSM 44938]MDT0346003.1 LysR family transcriptional regulator [Streptomyces sp. DSM 44938]